MFAITGATGKLGRLVIEGLAKQVPPADIVACVRDPKRAGGLADLGVLVRTADYDRPQTIRAALRGVDKLLLVSSNEVGRRLDQHRAVLDAAKDAGVGQVVYTSMLHADASPAKLAREHYATERALTGSSLLGVILRNGWYIENHLIALPKVLEHGAVFGAAGSGRFSGAARADFADAAIKVLTTGDHAGTTFELAGDTSFTLADVAAEIGRQLGKPIAYKNLSEEAYREMLTGLGLPGPLAEVLADEDAVAAQDTLLDDGHALSRLIGRPTTSLRDVIAAAIEGAGLEHG